jgi:hypothetical protein
MTRAKKKPSSFELERLQEECELLKAQVYDLKEESTAYARGFKEGKSGVCYKSVMEERDRCLEIVNSDPVREDEPVGSLIRRLTSRIRTGGGVA